MSQHSLLVIIYRETRKEKLNQPDISLDNIPDEGHYFLDQSPVVTQPSDLGGGRVVVQSVSTDWTELSRVHILLTGLITGPDGSVTGLCRNQQEFRFIFC